MSGFLCSNYGLPYRMKSKSAIDQLALRDPINEVVPQKSKSMNFEFGFLKTFHLLPAMYNN